MGGSLRPDRVRAFVAIPVPEPQRRQLGAHLEECARLAPGYRWVPPDNLHLTLRFLGSLDPATLDRLEEELVAVRGGGFRLGLDGRGTFGPRSAPRVIWLGLAAGADESAQLASAIEAASRTVGLEPADRPFRAHLTLARSRPDAPRLPALPEPPALEPWIVDDFVLYESRLGGRNAAAYVPLRRYSLTRE